MATSGRHMARFSARNCAIGPVRTVPIHPSSQRWHQQGTHIAFVGLSNGSVGACAFDRQSCGFDCAGKGLLPADLRYVAKDLAAYLKQHGLGYTRGRPYHPMTQGKIERYPRSMKNVVRLENHDSPWELERALARFVEYYNHERLHEAIGNVTPDDMYHGRQRAILSRREKIKRLTLERRKKENLRNAA